MVPLDANNTAKGYNTIKGSSATNQPPRVTIQPKTTQPTAALVDDMSNVNTTIPQQEEDKAATLPFEVV